MKKLALTICLVLGLVIMAAPTLAAPWDINHVINYSLYNSVGTPYGSGGLFKITDITANPDAVIWTFCIELDEHIYQNDRVAGISNLAVAGGRENTGPDPISSATGWLYAQYVLGNLNYNDTKALQIAFWMLEEGVTQAEALSWFGAALRTTANDYVADAQLNGGTEGTYWGTQVLNLKSATTEDPHQSHLIYVPEPGILILLGLAMSAIGAASWRLRKL